MTKVVVITSGKGGVGKTTTTLGLGSALAMVRADRVIAVDANPDRGTLAERVADTSTTSTVRHLLRDPHIRRYADVRRHTPLATSRLEDADPFVRRAAAVVLGLHAAIANVRPLLALRVSYERWSARP